jgi:hypothetical protein
LSTKTIGSTPLLKIDVKAANDDKSSIDNFDHPDAKMSYNSSSINKEVQTNSSKSD